MLYFSLDAQKPLWYRKTRLHPRDSAMLPGSKPLKRTDRFPLVESCPFEIIESLGEEVTVTHRGQALLVNISSKGMLLLMDQPPGLEQELRVQVPTPLTMVKTPARAEVRWKRKVLMDRDETRYFVGVRFLLRCDTAWREGRIEYRV